MGEMSQSFIYSDLEVHGHINFHSGELMPGSSPWRDSPYATIKVVQKKRYYRQESERRREELKVNITHWRFEYF